MTSTPVTATSIYLSDESFAQLIIRYAKEPGNLLVVANGYTALAASQQTDGTWVEIGRGDLGLKAGEEAKKVAAANKLYWLDAAASLSQVDLAKVSGTPAKKAAINAWLKSAEDLTTSKGRGDMPSKVELEYLGYQAGWRCQFAGCGKDLKRDSLGGARGVFSYFAHIVASSPIGPRGDALLSAQLTSDVTNVILLCDECHRRIDRVDPDRFTVDALRKMRQDSINEVRRLLNTLRYQEAIPLVIMGNITAQSPRFVQLDAEEAMWTRQLRMSPQGPEHYFYNGGHLHDPHAATYWGSLFESLRDDVPLMRKRLNGSLRGDGTNMPLAVFPLHGTSLLVLAGRIVGEGSPVTVFQYNRDRPVGSPGGKWAFDAVIAEPLADKYRVLEIQKHVSGEEACLVVSLTYKIDLSRLPPNLLATSGAAVGALEVTASDPSNLGANIISHPLDLDFFAIALEGAIRTMHDRWNVKKVHLVVGAPASACFRIGQKLQARHHATIVCYEALPGSRSQFCETIEIANDKVRELQTGKELSLL